MELSGIGGLKISRDLSLLRSCEEQAPVPPNKFMGDVEELAASYERKLIEPVLAHSCRKGDNETSYKELMCREEEGSGEKLHLEVTEVQVFIFSLNT
ncbi:hypothetical protein D4764_01G0013530 [Takifugu flavidus]|uniref:Uncharacterized protein n=1 Tax=Takifugu flavidus TaxID=433684 RepID=A0A5C6PRU7_9TELE|nr:hypothetical protein D4764_01G0013530 [Takifugu flavidus]